MISIEDACKIALEKIPVELKIIKVVETPLFWIFTDERFEQDIFGPCPLIVFKKDGRTSMTRYLTSGEAVALDQGKEIPFPEYLVKSGRSKRIVQD